MGTHVRTPGGGREGRRRKQEKCFVFSYWFLFLFLLCFFFDFLVGVGGGGGGGQERNILRQVRNLNVWGAGKLLLKRCYIITHVVPVKYILSAHIHIPLSNGKTE